MKIVLITIIVMIAVVAGSYFAGQYSANQSKKIDCVQTVLQNEHKDILADTNEIKNNIDILSSRMERIENKLDILVKIATSSAYVNDTQTR
jgi:predicted phage-related endonuclease